MMTTTLWIVAILLSVFMLEQMYEDTRSLDRHEEEIYGEKPATLRALGVAFITVGAIWGFGIALAALVGFIA